MGQQTYPDKKVRDKILREMRKERGLYTGKDDESFKSDEQVKRELALKGVLPKPSYSTPLKKKLNIREYLQSAEERGQRMKEMSPQSESYIEVELPDEAILNFLGDYHFGSPHTINRRIGQELEVIKNTPNSWVVLMGDLLEGIHWGGVSGAEQSQTLDEQRGFLRALFDELEGKVIMGTGGEHDSKWASKTGSDPYFDFTERTGAPYIRGVAEVKIKIGEQEYDMVVQHRARGHSMYNKNHPTFREARFELQGGMIYASAHTHRKQISQETIRRFGGAEKVTHISIGTYKSGDVYGDQQGFVSQNPKEMFGAAIRLRKDTKLVEVEYDILEAHRRWA